MFMVTSKSNQKETADGNVAVLGVIKATTADSRNLERFLLAITINHCRDAVATSSQLGRSAAEHLTGP
ncbi:MULTISPECIES: hypothetical protein [unclassified Rhizobium]|uniref:hypothetical protein n=1 Tax=unclassified Rhizobium TaxID=2613769 RepID=UPI00177B187D|nr:MULTISPECIES: hypothetical protein [unclassified Rhizobium]MBD8685493.1 hypothetical protein [Rhizobium sp. CFBP 13644]MBD8690834.1 hypothetical protein [Rhizobium sp. CFBP 13717]